MSARCPWLAVVSCALIAAGALRCTTDEPETPESFDTPSCYFSTARALVVDAAYEPGAEPYAGTGAGGGQTWSLLAGNLDSLVACHTQIDTVAVPRELAAMQALPVQNRATWSVQAIVQLADAHRPRLFSADTGVFWIAFVNGYYDRGGTADSGVIGVSLSGTGVIAVFKDVVERAAATEAVRRFVEQSTLVHEMGHALGMVNNPVPPLTAHEDPSHARHCSDQDCIMYWANEGIIDLAGFAQRYLTSGRTVLFCGACRGDICAYRP